MHLHMPLPLELVLNIVTCCAPPSPDVLLAPSHPTTKLLLSFTLVCHQTRSVAMRYLRRHCLILASQTRLSRFLLAIPHHPELRSIRMLSLAPFGDDIDDWPLCSRVQELLYFTCTTLTKLIIDMPLRTCYPEDDHLAVRPLLRQGFERLTNLEEFVSIQDELYLDTADGEYAVVWACWPKLKRLALYNVAADEEFWRHIARHPSVEALILSNPDCLTEVDPKTEYFKHTTKPLRVVICTSDHRRYIERNYLYTGLEWPKCDPDRNMELVTYQLTQYSESDCSRPFQEAVKDAAEKGDLWKWKGNEVSNPLQFSVVS